MLNDADVYDLGDVREASPRPAFAPKIKPARPRPVPASIPSLVPAVAGSLSLLLPGVGHLVLGQARVAAFLASGAAFLGATVWATLTTLDRLVPTLSFLGIPPRAAAIALGMAFLMGCVLHVGGVLASHRIACEAGDAAVPHPIVAAVASLLVPGWGQVLAGSRRRAALFLGSVWMLAGAWIAVSPLAERPLRTMGMELPVAARDGWAPLALVSLSAVVWVLAVYDAAACARAGRARGVAGGWFS